LKPWEQPLLIVWSDETGHYTIDGIPPGDYYLGVNIRSTPTKESPYQTVYYPNTPNLEQALRISFVATARAQDVDLRVSAKLPLVTVLGTIQTADGKPPSAKDYPNVLIDESEPYSAIEQIPIEIDAEGKFQFEVCEGIKYIAFASSGIFPGAGNSPKYSRRVEFTPTQENNRLVLALDQTEAQFPNSQRK
jgi:hypothetical protein